MNKSHELLQFLPNLTEMRSQSEVIACFLENLAKLFSPVTFIHVDREPEDNRPCFPVVNRNSVYGFIVPATESELANEYHTSLHNATQMVAVVLDNLVLKENLDKVRAFNGFFADDRQSEPERTGILHQESHSTFTCLAENQSHEVSENNQGDVALCEKDDELERFFLSSLDLLCIADTDGYFLRLNREWEKVLGYRRQDLEGKRFLDLVHPDDLAATLDAMAELHSQKEIHNFTNRFRSKDGTYRWIEWRSFPTGKLIYAAARDITARISTELALERMHNVLREAQKIANLGSFEYVIATQTTEWSEEEHQIFGLDPSKPSPTLSEILDKFIPPIDSQLFHATFSKAIQNASVFELEHRIKRADESVRWVSEKAHPYYDENGKLLKYIGTTLDITELKESERSLLESEANLIAILASTDDIIASYDREIRLIVFNKACYDTYRQIFDVNIYSGMRTLELFPESQREFWLKNNNRALLGEVFTDEFSIVSVDGEILYFESCFNPIRKGDDIVGFSTFTRNITARKRVEEALRESEAKYRHLIENSHDIIYSFTADGVLKFVSAAWTRILGHPIAEVESHSFTEFVHPDDLPHLTDFLHKVVETGDRQDGVEYRVRHANGTWCWHTSSASPARDASGVITHYDGIAHDITEPKQAELELLREKQFTEKLLESLPGIFFLYDSTCHLKRWNKAHETATGFTSDELRDWYIPNWHETPEDAAKGMALAKQVFETGVGGAFETTLINKQGHFVPYVISVTRLMTPDGPYMMGMGIDISERKQTEAEKEKLQVQLVQAQKMESVGRLAGGVAHDFNNMLQAILGYTTLALAELPLESPVRESLQEVLNCTQHSADLTRQLLAFARKQTIAPKVLDLNEIVAGTLKMLRRLIGEDIDLAWLPDSDLGLVNMDPSQVDQILANLCINARDAIGNGVGKVTIETANAIFDEAYCTLHAGYAPGEYVLLAVSDDGCGMDVNTLSHLFEPFFTTKELGKGTGLGLATVYGVVKQNNGLINVYSELSRGTTIKIYFPRHVAEPLPRIEETPLATTSGGETILLVEDEPSILKMIAMMLKSIGYFVIVANNPNEAISYAREHTGRIDLLMTDVVMPKMNGRELAQTLLSMCPEIKCLFMSGYTTNVIAHHGVLDEGVNFIQKPFSMPDLAAKVRKVLGN